MLLIQNKKLEQTFFSSKSNIIRYISDNITGKFRDRGSKFSHETRPASLLATLQLKEVCSRFYLRQFILGESTYIRLVFLVGFVLRPI